METEHSSKVLYVPICKNELKPSIGKKFKTVEDAVSFYEDYGRAVGFDTRKSGSKSYGGVITWQYVVCNREGKKRGDELSPMNERDASVSKRRRMSKRCDCNARMSVRYVFEDGYGAYVIHQFVEEHNHEMVETHHRRFMSLNRSIDDVHKKFIIDCANANIGPTLAFKLLNELLGGYDVVGCTVMEVRNYARDMKAYVEGSDAQMLLNEMQRKKETSGGFTFDFETDSEDKLKQIFWCDAASKRNFHMFGDVVAFDTTYDTNRYAYYHYGYKICLPHYDITSMAAVLMIFCDKGEDIDVR